ncbi:transmembrane protein 85 [Phyllosticta paracitricarpa]
MATLQVSPPPPPQWVLDLNSKAPAPPKNSNIPDPPGYTAPNKQTRNPKDKAPARKPPSAEEMDTLKLKKAWELAIAPAKSLPMNAIGMYMTGNSLQIFSIMMVFMLFKNPITALFNINRTFANFETPGTSSRLLGVKLVFVATNCLALALGIWKVNKMGLLPTTRSDWLAWEAEREPLERASFQGWALQ